ncbi:MAG: cupin domain-containing protein [Lentisphaeria bacterium]|nr:cupin domain-containing protein [Lentisphaeria bacterium]
MIIKRMTDGRPFDMGRGETRNVIGPEDGARHITFNYARFGPNVAFTQHVHDDSEDLILVLEGDGFIRLDDKKFPIRAGDVIHVAAGEYHGTVSGPNGMVAVSCQAPPDPKLLSGERNR